MFTEIMPIIYTRDIGRAAAFYRDQLGLTQTYQFPPDGQPRYIQYQLGGTRFALATYEAAVSNGLPEPSRGHPVGLVTWCADVDTETIRLRASGTPVIIEPHDHRAGHRRATLADPDGNWLSLVGMPA